MESAAALCGVSKDTLYRWLRSGKNSKSECLEKLLSDAVLKALAESEMRDLEIIDTAAMGTPDKYLLDPTGNAILDASGNPIITELGSPPNWKAAAWRLERKFPSRWGKTSKIALEETDFNNKDCIEIKFID